MRLGLGSYACTWQIGMPGHRPARPMDAAGLIARAAGLGLGLVQIDDNLPLEELDAGQLAELRRGADAHGVAIEVGTRGCAPEHLRRFASIAQALGSPLVRVVLDRGDDRPDTDEIARRLAAVAPAYRAAGLRLAIENHDRFTAAALAAVVRAAGDDWTGICLDTVNSLGAGEGPATVVAALMPLAVNLHIKDFAVARIAHQMGFTVEGRPAGEGQLDVPWLLAQARAAGYRGTMILELWTPPEADDAATIAKERAWAERSIVYLKSVFT